MNQLELMQASLPYLPTDRDLYRRYIECHKKTFRYNNLPPEALEEKERLIREILGKSGANIRIEPPFHCDYGFNIQTGDNFFANYNLVILDVGKVSFGDNVFLGPNVAIYAVSHPLHPETRARGYENGAPVKIGHNVWFGGNVVVNPGVSIGDNVVVGSGSIVCRDLPDNALAAGNPARVLRLIGEEDRQYYFKKSRFAEAGLEI